MRDRALFRNARALWQQLVSRAPETGALRSFLERRGPVFLVAVLSILAGTTLSLLLLPRAPLPPSQEEPAPPVEYLGAPLPLQEGALEEALRRTRALSERSFTLVLPEGPSEVLPLSSLGATLDTARLTRLIRDARDPTSALRAHWNALARGERKAARPEGLDESHTLPVPLFLESETALPVLLRLKDSFDRNPSDARLDLEKRSIVPHVTGRWLDVDRTLEAMENALARGELRAEAQFLTREPKRQAEALKQVQFDTVLGHFETKYNRARKYEDRTFNLRLAASRLDGTVLMPGEIFDFNDVVGPRDEASGYKVATVIADGELVDGIGGGTCQISGTLHGATFFAGLEIVERYPHTRPSSYIKMGMDATVVYPTINFRVRNPYDFPVVLHQTVSSGVVRAEVLGPPMDQVVTLIRKVDQALPYEEVERPDSRLPKGERVLSQRGIPGFRLHRYRVIRRGSHTVREKWRDVYPPTAQIVAVGTGPASNEGKRRGDPTPEFLADELLVLTQRRASGSDPGEFAENRVPGKFGERGWTQKSGMPFWAD